MLERSWVAQAARAWRVTDICIHPCCDNVCKHAICDIDNRHCSQCRSHASDAHFSLSYAVLSPTPFLPHTCLTWSSHVSPQLRSTHHKSDQRRPYRRAI